VNSSYSYLLEEYQSAWQNEKTRLELENQNILSNVRQLKKEKINYILTAPISGTLIQVAGFNTGNFVAPNQPLAYISTSDSLLVECYLSPLDIGYIKEEQNVVCLIDAFDYHQWGMLEGQVVEILSDIVNISDNPFFRVRCRLNANCLKLKNGYSGCVKKGMTLSCRFYLTRRSLWQLLFDKIDNWMNPKLITE
jgi:HlyD family secretion protein